VVSAGDDDLTAAPAIVMVASSRQPTALVLSATAALGRVITAGGVTHELADERMSRDHATVRWERGSWVIGDLDSRNGTFVNGERIAGEVKRRGDVIVRLGHTVFVLVGDGRGHPAADANAVVIGPELGRVYHQIAKLAAGGKLLVQGATGSGKQLAARAFHDASPRAGGPFVPVICSGIPGVAERLLFGGKKGFVETIGQLQLARGGTLYLAELAELDPTAQGALIKLFDAGTADCNLVCSGHDLRTAVADGKLRGDLLERLTAVSVTIPLLRMRRVDLARLIQLELAEVAAQQRCKLEAHPRLMETCLLRPWPGNVRELRAAVRLAATRAIADRRELVKSDDLLDTAGLPPGASSAETAVERKSGQGELSRANLIAAMTRANNVLAAAARALGLHRSQLAKLLEENHIPYEGLAHDD
jgi:DNA-binding NtrC family response regulator